MTDTAQETPEPYVFDPTELRAIANAIDLARELAESAAGTELFFDVAAATVRAGDEVLGQIRWDDGFIGFAARGVPNV